MRKILSVILAVILLCPICVFAADGAPTEDITKVNLPKPQILKYMKHYKANRNADQSDNDMLTVYPIIDDSIMMLANEWYVDTDAFYEKYGLYSFYICIQIDSSLNGTNNWNYNEEWDTVYYAPGINGEAATSCTVSYERIEEVVLFDLYERGPYTENYNELYDALIRRDVQYGDYTYTSHFFDSVNHSLSVRYRYYMEWETWDGETVGDLQSKCGPWSDVSVFGKNGNTVTPDEPETYAAPVISKIKYNPPMKDYEFGYITYVQKTPVSVWDAEIYYKMTYGGEFWGLETQFSVDGGPWIEGDTANSWGNWCLVDGERTLIFHEDYGITADSTVKVRIRFTGTHGPSPWSNVLEWGGKIMGDLNADRIVNTTDLYIMKQLLKGDVDLTDYIKEVGNLNEDEVVNSSDMNLLKRMLLGA